jgi:hypothetical protein
MVFELQPRRDRHRLAASLLVVLCAPHPGDAQTSPSASAPSLGTSAADQTVIYVVRRSWHIDFGFAAAQLQPPLNAVAAKFPGARFVFFGFGDRHYLEAKHHTPWVSLRALWPGAAVILVTAVDAAPEAAFGSGQAIALPVTRAQAIAAQAFVVQSLDQASVEPFAPGPYEGSLFFKAAPKYSAAHTCNTWVAEGLKAADLPIRSAGVVFAGQLWPQVQRLGSSLEHVDQRQGGWDPSWQTTVVPEF